MSTKERYHDGSVFVIVRPDGQFSRGGWCPSWTPDLRRAKKWHQLNYARTAVTASREFGDHYAGCSIVELGMREVGRHPLRKLPPRSKNKLRRENRRDPGARARHARAVLDTWAEEIAL